MFNFENYGKQTGDKFRQFKPPTSYNSSIVDRRVAGLITAILLELHPKTHKKPMRSKCGWGVVKPAPGVEVIEQKNISRVCVKTYIT